MRLLQSVLVTLPQTKKPQRKFITHLLGLVLMLPGHATFRNLSRYSSYHERTPDRVRGRLFARWYERPFDLVALNKAAITQVIPPEHQQALVIDASFIPKSGAHTYGLERFWNSRYRRSEKGLEDLRCSLARYHRQLRLWPQCRADTPKPTRPLSRKAHASMLNLLERISQHLAQGHSLEKSSPDYQDLCNYGTITDRAA